MISWHGLKSAKELIKLVICGHNYWKKKYLGRRKPQWNGEKKTIYMYLHSQIYMFSYMDP